jgi:hypothetical protein
MRDSLLGSTQLPWRNAIGYFGLGKRRKFTATKSPTEKRQGLICRAVVQAQCQLLMR